MSLNQKSGGPGKTSIIILTHNQLHITHLCLESIRRHTTEPYEIIVVDNGSSDHTVPYLLAQPDVITVRNDSNLGFAKGCNQGTEAASGDTLLYLNNDTIVTEHWLTHMLEVLYSEDSIGMVGPVTNYASGQQQIPVSYQDISGIDAFAEAHLSQHRGHSFDVRRLVGFCMLVKRPIIEELGGFDERFGLGNYEDDDFCLRFINSGYRLRVVVDSFVHHFGHMTTNILQGYNLGELLAVNKEKAKEKWGKDIHTLLYKEAATFTLVLPIRKDLAAELPLIQHGIRELADEIIVVDFGASPEQGAEVSAWTDKIIAAVESSPEEWWPKVAASATGQFLMWVNPDEQLEADEKRRLNGLKLSLEDGTDAVSVLIQLTDGMNGDEGASLVRRNRVMKRTALFGWNAIIGDFLPEPGAVLRESDIVLKMRKSGFVEKEN